MKIVGNLGNAKRANFQFTLKNDLASIVTITTVQTLISMLITTMNFNYYVNMKTKMRMRVSTSPLSGINFIFVVSAFDEENRKSHYNVFPIIIDSQKKKEKSRYNDQSGGGSEKKCRANKWNLSFFIMSFDGVNGIFYYWFLLLILRANGCKSWCSN